MRTKQQLIVATPIHQAECRHLGRNNQVATRIYAAIMTSAVVLPAILPAILFFEDLRFLGLILVGILLKGFGVPFYLLLHWSLEEEAKETESAQYLPTRAIDERLAVGPQHDASGDSGMGLALSAWQLTTRRSCEMITTKDRIKIYFKGWGVGWPALKAFSQNTLIQSYSSLKSAATNVAAGARRGRAGTKKMLGGMKVWMACAVVTLVWLGFFVACYEAAR